jgi:hypothetical protein
MCFVRHRHDDVCVLGTGRECGVAYTLFLFFSLSSSQHTSACERTSICAYIHENPHTYIPLSISTSRNHLRCFTLAVCWLARQHASLPPPFPFASGSSGALRGKVVCQCCVIRFVHHKQKKRRWEAREQRNALLCQRRREHTHTHTHLHSS